MAETIPLGEKSIRSGKGAGGARFATPYSGDYPDRMIAWFRERANPVIETVDKFERTVLVPGVVPSMSGFAAVLGVPKSTLEQWKEEHKGFEAAYKICREIEQAALEQLGSRIPGSAKYVLAKLKTDFGWETQDAGAGDLPVPTYGPIGSTPAAKADNATAPESDNAAAENTPEDNTVNFKEAANDSVKGER